MRYTTCIDITEFPNVYNNVHARMLYFHLCLKSGYHDDDRDMLHMSLRRLADDVGMTLSALRHALKVLHACRLISVTRSTITVKKWVDEKPITKRKKLNQAQTAKVSATVALQTQKILDEQRRQDAEKRAELERKGLSSFIVYYENRIKQYHEGDVDALASLKRNRDMYLSECERMKHKPIEL